MNRALLAECFRVEGRKTWYEEPAEIQRDLDRFLRHYNLDRSHQGYRLRGKTPAQASREALGRDEGRFGRGEIAGRAELGVDGVREAIHHRPALVVGPARETAAGEGEIGGREEGVLASGDDLGVEHQGGV